MSRVDKNPKDKVKSAKKASPKTPCEYFGQVPKVHTGKIDADLKTFTHRLTVEQAEELRGCLAEAVSHARRAERQRKSRIAKRSDVKPINTVLLTTHRDTGQMIVLGKLRKKR